MRQDVEIDKFYEEYVDLPPLLREKSMLTFESYVNSRKVGFTQEAILEYLGRWR